MERDTLFELTVEIDADEEWSPWENTLCLAWLIRAGLLGTGFVIGWTLQAGDLWWSILFGGLFLLYVLMVSKDQYGWLPPVGVR